MNGIIIMNPYEFGDLSGEERLQYLTGLFEENVIVDACKEARGKKFSGSIQTSEFQEYTESIKTYSDLKQLIEQAKKDKDTNISGFALDLEELMHTYAHAS